MGSVALISAPEDLGGFSQPPPQTPQPGAHRPLPLPTVTLSRALESSEPQFPHLYGGDDHPLL